MKLGLKDKTVWDLVSLLIIPLVLFIATEYLKRNFERIEQERIEQLRQQELIKSYLKDITDILINSEGALTKASFNSDLKKLQYNDIQNLAGARTVITLQELNPRGRSQVMNFLSDADLFDNIPLRRSVLDGTPERKRRNFFIWKVIPEQKTDLKNIYLKNGNLGEAFLKNVNLDGANLEGANLKGAVIENSTFKKAIWNECTRFPENFNPQKETENKKRPITEEQRRTEGGCRYPK